MWRTYLNRTLCEVLEEMRKSFDTRNFSYLLGLIEEAQSMGQKMEAKLGDLKDHESLLEQISKAKKELKALEDRKDNIKPKTD